MAMGHPFLITMSTKVTFVCKHLTSICHALSLGLLSQPSFAVLNCYHFDSQVSQVWFSERERIFTTAAMAGAAAFGAMIGELWFAWLVSRLSLAWLVSTTLSWHQFFGWLSLIGARTTLGKWGNRSKPRFLACAGDSELVPLQHPPAQHHLPRLHARRFFPPPPPFTWMLICFLLGGVVAAWTTVNAPHPPTPPRYLIPPLPGGAIFNHNADDDQVLSECLGTSEGWTTPDSISLPPFKAHPAFYLISPNLQ